ncbi:MAG TPA: NUDIX hydrolase [Pyrinomonadaceae bacterium]|nr:NUDIX hydrolase [Pyrinomonadaceae bacterium]
MLKIFFQKIWQSLPPAFKLKITRLSQDKFTVSAAAIVLNEKGEVLLLDHVFRSQLSWGLPGGFIEHGESPEEGIRREIYEETGLELENLGILRVRTINRHIEILFRATAKGKAEVKSREIKAAGWFKPDDLPEKISHVQKNLIKKFLE